MIKKVLLLLSVMALLSLLLFESPVLAYIKWEVVLTPDTTSGHEWESYIVWLPYIMYDYQDSIYKMWYNGRGPSKGYGSYQANGIGYAISVDGVNWGNRQLIQGYTSPTYYQVSMPWVIKAGETYKIWHRHYFDRCGGEWSSYINYCESLDGISWGSESYNFGCPGTTWELYFPGMMLGSIVQKAESTFLYYDAVPPDRKDAIGRVVSIDSGRTWIDSTRAIIVSPDSVEFCDSIFVFSSVHCPNVTLEEDGTYRMFFSAYTPEPPYKGPIYIYEGFSQDGLHWNPDSLKLFLAPYMLGNNISQVRWPFYLKDKDGKEYLYFTLFDSTLVPYPPTEVNFPGKIGRALLNQIVNGDCNCDSAISLADPIYLANYILKSGSSPCDFKFADVNADCAINLADVIYLANYVLKSGPKPLVSCCSNF